MKKSTLPEPLRTRLTQVMRDHSLAKFGDALTNFVYSLAKTRQYKQSFGERVLDKSLAEAIRNANLRAMMPSSVSSGDLGDGAEALIGHAYLKKIMTIDEMVALLISVMQTKTLEEISYRSNERLLMAEAFEKVLLEIVERMS